MKLLFCVSTILFVNIHFGIFLRMWDILKNRQQVNYLPVFAANKLTVCELTKKHGIRQSCEEQGILQAFPSQV